MKALQITDLAKSIGADRTTLSNWKRRGYIQADVITGGGEYYSEENSIRIFAIAGLTRIGVPVSRAAKFLSSIPIRSKKLVCIPFFKEGFEIGFLRVDIPYYRNRLREIVKAEK